MSYRDLREGGKVKQLLNKMKIKKQYYRIRGFRISNKVWDNFKKLKPKDITWNLFFVELINIYNKYAKMQ